MTHNKQQAQTYYDTAVFHFCVVQCCYIKKNYPPRVHRKRCFEYWDTDSELPILSPGQDPLHHCRCPIRRPVLFNGFSGAPGRLSRLRWAVKAVEFAVVVCLPICRGRHRASPRGGGGVACYPLLQVVETPGHAHNVVRHAVSIFRTKIP